MNTPSIGKLVPFSVLDREAADFFDAKLSRCPARHDADTSKSTRRRAAWSKAGCSQVRIDPYVRVLLQ